MDIPEILLHICGYLTPIDLLSCNKVNRLFHTCSTDNSIWSEYISCPIDFESHYTYYCYIHNETYYHRTSKCRIFELNSNDHFQIKGIFEIGNIQELVKYCPEIKRGDIISCPEFDDHIRNVHLFIYDGNKVETLTFGMLSLYSGYKYGSYDGIGVIPIHYSTPDEFPFQYWSNVANWDVIPFDPYPYIEELMNNYSETSRCTWFMYLHIKFYICAGNKCGMTDPIRRRRILLTSSYIPYRGKDFDPALTLTLY